MVAAQPAASADAAFGGAADAPAVMRRAATTNVVVLRTYALCRAEVQRVVVGKQAQCGDGGCVVGTTRYAWWGHKKWEVDYAPSASRITGACSRPLRSLRSLRGG